MGVARRQSALGPRVGHDCQRPAATGHGYHVVDLGGHVYAFGDAPYLGAVTPPVAVRGHQMRVLEHAPPTGFGASPMCRSGRGQLPQARTSAALAPLCARFGASARPPSTRGSREPRHVLPIEERVLPAIERADQSSMRRCVNDSARGSCGHN